MIEKNLQLTNPDKNKQEIVQRQEYKLIGSQRRVKGLRLWSFNPLTDEVQEVLPKREALVNLDGTTSYKTKVQWDAKLVYLQALNYANAVKKAYKHKYSAMEAVRDQVAEELKRRGESV